MPKPTIILIPGGYNNPGPTPTIDIPIYKNFNDALRNEGFPVVSVPYPSLIRSNPAQCTCAQDVDFIRNEVLLPKVERGEHVVLVMHSYGSIPACGAAKGLSTVERRREGKKGGVLGLVCVSAFLLPPGTSIAGECPGGDLPYWVRQNEVCFSPLVEWCACEGANDQTACRRPCDYRGSTRKILLRSRGEQGETLRGADSPTRRHRLQVTFSCARVVG